MKDFCLGKVLLISKKNIRFDQGLRCTWRNGYRCDSGLDFSSTILEQGCLNLKEH